MAEATVSRELGLDPNYCTLKDPVVLRSFVQRESRVA